MHWNKEITEKYRPQAITDSSKLVKYSNSIRGVMKSNCTGTMEKCP